MQVKGGDEERNVRWDAEIRMLGLARGRRPLGNQYVRHQSIDPMKAIVIRLIFKGNMTARGQLSRVLPRSRPTVNPKTSYRTVLTFQRNFTIIPQTALVFSTLYSAVACAVARGVLADFCAA